MVSVEPIGDKTLAIKIVQDPIRIVFKPCREDHKLIVIVKLGKELQRARSRSVVSKSLLKKITTT